MTKAPSVPALLRSHGLQPKRSLGQSFLSDPGVLDRIAGAADLCADDVVVEVGAGLGTLTLRLAELAGQVVAIELDHRLIEILRAQVSCCPNVRIVHGDVLELPDLGFGHDRYKVVANLPYYITSAILRRFLEADPRPRLMVITVQREVADRIVADPGEMSLLGLSVQFYGRPSIVARIKAGAFYPPPQVDSAVVRIDVGEGPTVALADGIGASDFFRVARAGFGQKRKMLRNSLAASLGLTTAQVEAALAQAGVSPRLRAEKLSLEEWAGVAEALFPLLQGPAKVGR